MAISTETRRSDRYACDGVQTAFPFAFKVFKADEIGVIVSPDGETETTLSSELYTVSLNEDQDNDPGGVVNLLTAPADGTILVVVSNVAYKQQIVFTNQGGFYPELLNEGYDRLTILTQQLKEHLDRTITVPPTSPTSPQELFYQLLNAAKESLESAQSAEEALAACEQIRQLIEQYSWDIPHIVDSLRDVEDYPYDGLFAVAGFGNAGGKGQNISNRYVKAEGSTELRTLGERFADVVNVRDFGAVGDGVTDDTAAIQAALNAGGGRTVWFPSGTYLVSETLHIPHGNCTIQGYGASLTLSEYDSAEGTAGVVGLKAVGVSGISIFGLDFKKFCVGVRILLSENGSDYPATETNCISNIRIQNCSFDTAKWAIHLCGVRGAIIDNIWLNQKVIAGYNNADGVHLNGCSNINISGITGASGDDYVAIFPRETVSGITPETRTFFGVCNKIFISKCIIQNAYPEIVKNGARSFLGIDGCDLTGTGVEDKFSIDNVFVSDCSIETNTGCILRITGGNEDTYVGTIQFDNCYFNRSYIANYIVNYQNGATFVIKSSVDELIIRNSKNTFDSQYNETNFTQPVIAVYRNLRVLKLENTYLEGVSSLVKVDNQEYSNDSPMEYLGIRNCEFKSIESVKSYPAVVNVSGSVNEIEIDNCRGTALGNWLYLQQESNIETVRLSTLDKLNYIIVNVDDDVTIGKFYLRGVNSNSPFISLNDTYKGTFTIVGDFTNSGNDRPVTHAHSRVSVSGVTIPSKEFYTGSSLGSVVVIQGQTSQKGYLAVKNTDTTWVALGETDASVESRLTAIETAMQSTD